MAQASVLFPVPTPPTKVTAAANAIMLAKTERKVFGGAQHAFLCRSFDPEGLQSCVTKRRGTQVAFSLSNTSDMARW